jgi:hypothetical protein
MDFLPPTAMGKEKHWAASAGVAARREMAGFRAGQ